MSKPHFIPQDVWNAADDVWTDLANGAVGKSRDEETALIARAIMSERNRCAKVAHPYSWAAAKAIRRGDQP